MDVLQKIPLFLKKAYSPDPRALAAMRIGMALLILTDLLIRGMDLSAHYTDGGVWPTQFVHTFAWKAGYWSFHDLSGSFVWTLSLFVLHFILALLLLIGFKTRWVTLLLFVFTISLHNRNLFVLQAGDDLLRLILLWGIFIPWGNHYSIDSRRSEVLDEGPAFAGVGYLLCLASVYLFAVALRDTSEWHSEGSAVYFALSLEQIRLPAGTWIYYHPNLLRALTHVVYYSELLIPFLILFPGRNKGFRFAAFVIISLLHVGFGLTIYVGLFYLIGIVTAIGLLPSWLFDKAEHYLGSGKKEQDVRHSQPVISFLTNFICILVIAICFMINLSHLKWFQYKLKNEVVIAANSLRLDQYWGMFSPGVLRKDGWYVYHGFDSVGRQWDLRLNQDYVDYKKPRTIVSMYKSDRWRKLAENMQDDRFTFLRPLYCRYMLNQWNVSHREKQILGLNLYFMEKINLPDYKTKAPIKQLYCVCTVN